MNRQCLLLIPLMVIAQFALAQNGAPPPTLVDGPAATKPPRLTAAPATITPPSDYVLGPFDQITVLVGEFPDQFGDRSFRIDGNGDVSLPLAGRVHAGGLTPKELEDEIKKHLAAVLKSPDVVVNVSDFTSTSVSVLGAVNLPGMHPLVGQKSLFEELAVSQGLTDEAGSTVKITRAEKWGVIPLPNVTMDPGTHVSTAIVRIKDVTRNGPENIALMPGDAIFVPRADLIYVVGSVTKPGGFPIGEKETISALQVVSRAEGLQRTAAPEKAKILRAELGKPSRIEIPVNIKLLMAGKTPDIPLQADDILFIPNSGAKSAAYRTTEAILAAATGVAIYSSRP
jgi:polysaccharide biosynthesis/export protein